MRRYHDEEWGVPVHEDRKWFEYLVLDGFQAGLSWRTVLHKRPAFKTVFSGFDPARVARMSRRQLEAATRNPAIVRNRMKIEAAVGNAKSFIRLQEEHGSFNDFIWSFTGGQIVRNSWKRIDEVPASSPLSDRVSAVLKKSGFSFVGTTICYAILQSGGIVNDHLVGCFRYEELAGRDSGPGYG
jgi:DNA-3-methyladenine glycosylase I